MKFLNIAVKCSTCVALLMFSLIAGQVLDHVLELQTDRKTFQRLCDEAQIDRGACAMMWHHGTQPALVQRSAYRPSGQEV